MAHGELAGASGRRKSRINATFGPIVELIAIAIKISV
jgi:hypothetical protein